MESYANRDYERIHLNGMITPYDASQQNEAFQRQIAGLQTRLETLESVVSEILLHSEIHSDIVIMLLDDLQQVTRPDPQQDERKNTDQ